MPEGLGPVLDDAAACFSYMKGVTHQERCHAYISRRGVCRGYDETATEAVVRDLCERAWQAGRDASHAPCGGAAEVRRCLAEALEAAAQRLAGGS